MRSLGGAGLGVLVFAEAFISGGRGLRHLFIFSAIMHELPEKRLKVRAFLDAGITAKEQARLQARLSPGNKWVHSGGSPAPATADSWNGLGGGVQRGPPLAGTSVPLPGSSYPYHSPAKDQRQLLFSLVLFSALTKPSSAQSPWGGGTLIIPVYRWAN